MGKQTKYALKSQRRDPSYRRVEGNLPAKKYKKGTPTVTRLSFEFTGNDTKYIDLAKALSILNRKFFRQGVYYYVNSVEMYDNETSHVDLFTAPDNWVTRAAHRRGKAIFDEMNDEAMKAVGNLAPKYHDFKVFLNTDHRTTGSLSPSLYNAAGANTLEQANEWLYSVLVSKENYPDGSQVADSFNVHLIGPHGNEIVNGTNQHSSVGLIKSYADTRVRQNSTSNPTVDPNLLSDPLLRMFDGSPEDSVDQIVTNLDELNDQAPYQNDIYVGESSQDHHHVLRLHTIPDSGRVAMGAGFCAPCGLVMVVPSVGGAPNGTGEDNTWRLVFNLAVGTYNGVYAERV